MSMDEQYAQMQRFTHALEEFNQRLAHSMQELEEQHNTVAPLWQDEMRKSYDTDWLPLHTLMTQYTRIEGIRYVDFLTYKMRLLERYLRG